MMPGSKHGLVTTACTKVHAKDKLSAFKWSEHDWDQLRRDLGTVADSSEDAAPDTVKIAAELHSKSCTVVVFCNPALLQQTMPPLSNKTYIKLCGDGTWRLTSGDWVFLRVGAL